MSKEQTITPPPVTEPTPHTMAIQRYVDNNGQPTCATDIANKCYCPFLLTSVFGTREHCFWEMRDNPGPHPSQLERRDRGRGFIAPYPDCPLWK